MTAKKKTKTNKQDVWKKQEVETAILDAFSQFEASKLKDKNLFVLMNMIFKNLKTLDLPQIQTELNSNDDATKEYQEEKTKS